jgi:hypothetical protein
MADTATSFAISDDDAPHVALVLIFEGYNLGVTDSDDAAGLALAWSNASEWSDIRGGLEVSGSISASARPFDAEVKMEALTLRLTDDDEHSLGRIFLRESNSDAVTSTLRVSMDSSSSAILWMESSAGFPAAGTVHIGNEEIAYTLNTGSGILLGLTRGVRALFGRETDATHFGRPHRIDQAADPEDPPDFAPTVSTVPLEWSGRNVALYVCVKENGAWTAGANAECLWAGTIRTIHDGGETIGLECSSILEKLKGVLLRKQYKARLADGGYFTTAQGFIDIRIFRTAADGTLTEYNVATANLFASSGIYTHEQVFDLINDQLDAWFGGGSFSTMNLNLVLEDNVDAQEQRYQWVLEDSAAGSYKRWEIDIGLTSMVWDILGWDGATLPWFPGGRSAGIRTRERIFRSLPGEEMAPAAPIAWGAAWLSSGDTIYLKVTDVEDGGELALQGSNRLPPGTPAGTTLFLRVGGQVLLPAKLTGDASIFEVTGVLPASYEALGITVGARDRFGRLLELMNSLRSAGQSVLVEQVWFEVGFMDETFLRLLCSTGTRGYSADDWDVYPEQMGLGLPWQMVDQTSIIAMLGQGYVLYIDKPITCLELFEGAMQVRNRHAFFHRGKLTVTGFGESGSATLRLTEANKALPVDGALGDMTSLRSECFRTTDYLVNRIRLQYNLPLGGDGKPDTIVVNNTASQTDLETIAPVAVDARGMFQGIDGIGDSGVVDAWVEDVAAPALAYFGRPLVEVHRTFTLALFLELYPGRRVLLSDDVIMHPRTGERGITDVPAWVVSRGFPFDEGSGSVTLLFSPRNVP